MTGLILKQLIFRRFDPFSAPVIGVMVKKEVGTFASWCWRWIVAFVHVHCPILMTITGDLMAILLNEAEKQQQNRNMLFVSRNVVHFWAALERSEFFVGCTRVRKSGRDSVLLLRNSAAVFAPVDFVVNCFAR